MKHWPKEEYGEFFSGDSYIILNVSLCNATLQWENVAYPDINIIHLHSSLLFSFPIFLSFLFTVFCACHICSLIGISLCTDYRVNAVFLYSCIAQQCVFSYDHECCEPRIIFVCCSWTLQTVAAAHAEICCCVADLQERSRQRGAELWRSLLDRKILEPGKYRYSSNPIEIQSVLKFPLSSPFCTCSKVQMFSIQVSI